MPQRLHIFDPVATDTEPCGRVWTETAEYFWVGPEWISKEDPSTASVLTSTGMAELQNGYLNENAHEDRLKEVAEQLNGKWECFLPKTHSELNCIY